jgi:peptidoglycan/xylan/chitin deacetylase (PgdA/CDA1 family)
LWMLSRALEWSGLPGVVWRVIVLTVPHLILLVAAWKYGAFVFLSGGALLAGLYCLAVLRPSCGWLGEVKCATGDNSVLITIDDGPDAHDTPLLLDLLDRHGAKAVFFMIGEKAAAHPDLVREVIARGHEIGNHTMTHPQATFWCAGPWRTRREISACQQVITDITGVKPRWFRAPVGHRNFFTHPIATALGMKVMAWNRRGFDAVETDASKVLARILPGLGPGDIVLLHEGTPIAAEVLQAVIENIEH